MFSQVWSILIDLHWLPIAERIKFKILLLTFKALHEYLLSILKTWSLATSQLDLSVHRLPYAWTDLTTISSIMVTELSLFLLQDFVTLPIDIKSCDTIYSFKSKLKTDLFKIAFKLN